MHQFCQLSNRDRFELYVSRCHGLCKIWKGAYTGPAPICVDDERRDSVERKLSGGSVRIVHRV